MFPSRKPKPGRPNTRISAHGFYNAIAGARQAGGTGNYALLPLDGDPYIGYRVHAFRHTANQLIVNAAASCNEPTQASTHRPPRPVLQGGAQPELITDISAVYGDLDRQLSPRP